MLVTSTIPTISCEEYVAVLTVGIHYCCCHVA